MTSSYTTRLRLNKQGTGDNASSWGSILNSSVFDLVDTAIGGWSTVAVSSSASLTSVNGSADQSRAAVLKLTTATSTYTTTLPAVEKTYLVWNAATAAQTIASAGGGTSVSVDSGAIVQIMTDGTNVKQLGYSGYGLKDYIDQAILATTGSLPATTGNNGKVLACVAGAWTPTLIDSSYITSFSATAAQLWTGSIATAALTPSNTTSALAEVTLTPSGSTVTPDMTSFINGVISAATGSMVLAAPTAVIPGRGGRIRVVWTGSGTLTLNGVYKRSGGTVTFTGTNGTTDIIYYDPVSTSLVYYDVALSPS